MKTTKVTVILYPDEDGGFTAVMPYFSCSLTSQGCCLIAQGWTAEEAMEEARLLLREFIDRNGAEGRYHLECAHLDGMEIRDIEVELPD